MPHDVFISHSSKDKTTADAACAVLEAKGIRCWIAPRDILPGQDWSESILAAIGNSRIMLLIFSTQANESQQVKREVERAVNRGIAIIPFRIEDVLPTKALEYFLSTPHWLDAFSPPLEQHLNYLAEVIQQILKGPAEGDQKPVPPPRPVPWYRNRLALPAGGALALLLLLVVWFWPSTPGERDLIGSWRLVSSSLSADQVFISPFVLPQVRLAAFSNPDTLARMRIGEGGAYEFEMRGQDEGTYQTHINRQRLPTLTGIDFRSRIRQDQVDQVNAIMTRLNSPVPQLNARAGDFILGLSIGGVGQVSWIRRGGEDLSLVGTFTNPFCFITPEPQYPWNCTLEFARDNRYRADFFRTVKGRFTYTNSEYHVVLALGGPPQDGSLTFSGRDRIRLVSAIATTEWVRE